MNLQITNVPLLVRMTFEAPLTGEELLRFSEGNEVVWIEREADGSLYVKPIWDMLNGGRCTDVTCDLHAVYRVERSPEVIEGAEVVHGDGVIAGFELRWPESGLVAELQV